jgi:hypothetical protein
MAVTENTPEHQTDPLLYSPPPPQAAEGRPAPADFPGWQDRAQAAQAASYARSKTIVENAFPGGFENDETWKGLSMAQALRLLAEDNAYHMRGVANLLEMIVASKDASAFDEVLNYTARMLRSQAHLLAAAGIAAQHEERKK